MVNVKGSPPPRTTPAGLILAIAQLSTKERDLLVSAVREGDEGFAVPQERQIQLAVATAWSAGEISFALQVLERLYSRINDPEEDWPSSMATRARLSAEFEKALGNVRKVISNASPRIKGATRLK